MTTHVRWQPPVEMSLEEKRISKILKRVGKFYVFLREIRHELFDEQFQQELAAAYPSRGRRPLPPAFLATVCLLQAYDKTGDADAVVTAQMDMRWQLVLDCVGVQKAPFSQGVLSQFRQRMIEHDLDKKLLERTVELAKKTKSFGWQHLKVALDSSPLLGAGRVMDTWNLIGRALSTVVDCAAKATSTPRKQVIADTQLTLCVAPSVKTALDLDWDDPNEKEQGLNRLLGEVERVQQWVVEHASALAQEPPLSQALDALKSVLEQDIDPEPPLGQSKLRRGVAKDRMPSLGDPEMRHGRKTKSKQFNGYKRHIMKVLDADITVSAEVLPANLPEHLALPLLAVGAKDHGAIEDCFMDRGYLASPHVRRLVEHGTRVHCKPWKSRNGGRFTKDQFEFQLDAKEVICPSGAKADVSNSMVARFAKSDCAACELRPQCTNSKHGRTVTVHAQEHLLIELRQKLTTEEGRQKLRQRTTAEHTLARLQRIQGPKARYKGARKNTLDVRRCMAVDNLQTISRMAA